MKTIDVEDDYSIYWWIIRHFMLMDFESNKQILKRGYIKLDRPFKLINKDLKYFSKDTIIPTSLIINCMLGNPPEGYAMLDTYQLQNRGNIHG